MAARTLKLTCGICKDEKLSRPYWYERVSSIPGCQDVVVAVAVSSNCTAIESYEVECNFGRMSLH